MSIHWVGFGGSLTDWISYRYCDPFTNNPYDSYRIGPVVIRVY
jgi:hypothetical protein